MALVTSRLPLVIQGLAWLLALPVLVGLWIWQRQWPMVGRLTVIAALAGWNPLVMLPQAAWGAWTKDLISGSSLKWSSGSRFGMSRSKLPDVTRSDWARGTAR